MKVLFISPVPTDPCNAGNRARIATLTNTMQADGHEVHFAYIPMESADIIAMRIRFGADFLHLIDWKNQKEGIFKATARKIGRQFDIGRAFNYGIDSWYDSCANVILEALDRKHKFDAVFVEYVFMSKAFDAFSAETLKVLDTHDCFGLRYTHYLNAGIRPRWFSTSLLEEENGFRRADIVLAIQNTEAKYFAARIVESETRVLQIGHLMEVKEIGNSSNKEAAIFIASDNPINIAGANYFVDKILPQVCKIKPDFQFVLAGSVSNYISSRSNVTKLGFVDKIQDAFGSAMIAVNPVLAGTGINIKVLDAMAAGMPIITTLSGSRGLEAYADSAFEVVSDSDPDGFAFQLLRLLDEKSRRLRLSEAAWLAAKQWNLAQLSSLGEVLQQVKLFRKSSKDTGALKNITS